MLFPSNSAPPCTYHHLLCRRYRRHFLVSPSLSQYPVTKSRSWSSVDWVSAKSSFTDLLLDFHPPDSSTQPRVYLLQGKSLYKCLKYLQTLKGFLSIKSHALCLAWCTGLPESSLSRSVDSSHIPSSLSTLGKPCVASRTPHLLIAPVPVLLWPVFFSSSYPLLPCVTWLLFSDLTHCHLPQEACPDTPLTLSLSEPQP